MQKKSASRIERSCAEGIAERLRRKRIELGLSQEELGNRSGLHRTYIGALERAEKNVTVVTMARLAQALNCKIVDLLPE